MNGPQIRPYSAVSSPIASLTLLIADRIIGSLPSFSVGILHLQGIVFSAASGWLFTEGGLFSARWAKKIGAGGYSEDAIEAVKVALQLMKEKEEQEKNS